MRIADVWSFEGSGMSNHLALNVYFGFLDAVCANFGSGNIFGVDWFQKGVR